MGMSTLSNLVASVNAWNEPVVYCATIGDQHPLLMLPLAKDAAYFDACGGAPEAPLIAWAETLISLSDAFVDVGAHIGSWSLYFALRGHHVHAFEAHPELAGFVQRGAELNHVGDQVTVEACAISDYNGSAIWRNPVNSESGGGGSIVCDYRGSTLEHLTVPVRTLDSFGFERFGDRRVGLLKIDVEGAESLVLAGAQGLLRQHQPILLFEVWDDWRGSGESPNEKLFALLKELHYDARKTTWNEVWVADPRR
jgi:FkbM family methyltransferase